MYLKLIIKYRIIEMSRDKQSKIAQSKKGIRSKKDEERHRKMKKAPVSDSDSDSNYETDCSENEELDVQEYRKFLATMFPSKYMKKKVEASAKDERSEDDDEESWEDESESECDNYKKKSTKNKKSSKYESESECDSETIGSQDTDTDDDNESECDYESEEVDEKQSAKNNSNKLNIIFTIGGLKKKNDEEWETEDEDDTYDEDDVNSEEDTEDEDVSVSSDSSNDAEENDDENSISNSESDSSEEIKHSRKSKSKKQDKSVKRETKNLSKNKAKREKETTEDVLEKIKSTSDNEDSPSQILAKLKELYEHNKKDKSIQKCIEVYEKEIQKQKSRSEKKQKKQKAKNLRIFRKIVRDKNTSNDFNFYEKLEIEEQKKIIKELREINKITRIEKPYRMTLLESNIPVQFKAAAMKKINTLRHMEPGSGEFYKIKNWVDTFMRIPFGKYEGLPISIEDGVDKCHDFMENAQKTLENAVYGLNDAKMQIMQMLGQFLTNPKSVGTAIAIHGPPGTGKCHTYDTPILMYDGTTKMVQDIIIGDLIMGDDSQPRKVIDLGRGEDELYEIIQNRGEKYGVNSEHILCLKQSGLNKVKKMNLKTQISYKSCYFDKYDYRIKSKNFDNFKEANEFVERMNKEHDIIEISVKKYLELPKYISENLKGYHTAVDFKEKEVLFDPYIIGLWLGDGTSSKPEITNQDSTILHYLKNSIKKYNLSLNYYSGYTYRLAYDMYDNDSRNNKNMFLQALKDYNLLNNKHIPFDLKVNSREVRLQLLAGLIDSDGYYDRKCKGYQITQKNYILSNDILFLARSLGYYTSIKKCDKSCMYNGVKKTGEYYSINISGNNLGDIPVKCPRKIAEKYNSTRDHLVSGIEIKPIGYGKYYGFTLDGNNRYLLNDFTVTHNTSLVKEGISKILNRPFAFIALGGATDSSFLEGHSYTYEGSTWGKILQILIDSKCMNPVIYFDELDKISETPRGEEIAGILTHLTDTTQNSQFHDKYFAEINFDLSKCLFIFSYNDESKVNPILKDRMYRIMTKGYNQKEKTIISNNYLLPRIRDQVKFASEDIIIPDSTLHYIIENHCNKEDGVRNLKRCLEIIHTKLNLYRLMRPNSNLFHEDMSFKVVFPFTEIGRAHV